MSDRWSDRLSAYLDDELDRAERSAIETHLASCDECAGTLEALREVTARARRLENPPPARDLWPGIEARLAAAQSGASAGERAAAGAVHAGVPPTRVIHPARRIDFSLPQASEAVAELQRTLEQHRTELDSSTVRIVEQNLAVIDRAILQARRALAADPASPYLHQHLALQLKLKLDLLRRTAELSGA